MADHYKNYINGKWVDSKGGRTDNINPADTSDVIGSFPVSTAAEVDEAVKAARKAQKAWANVPAPRRGEILLRIKQLMDARKEDLARLMTREMGKILKETRGDVQEGTDTALYAAGEGRRLFGETCPTELPSKMGFSIRRPVGVCGLITPWNFPMAIPTWKMFPALICGNAVVLKPASETPATAAKLVEIVEEAGVPAGVVNLVFGSGSVAGDALVSHPDVNLISFTGSSATGKAISAKASETLKRVSLELGGKNAQIIMEDADIDLAVEGALWGAFGTTGQRCTATSRLIVHKAVKDEVMSRLLARAKKLKVGNGLDEATDMGPAISKKQRDSVHGYVEIGKKEGAKLLCGGEPLAGGMYDKGWFYAPTIFDGVTRTMRIFQEEIFGPVLSVVTIDSYDEAIETLNDSRYGLSSSIYTRDVNRACRALEDIEAGITYINGPTIGAEIQLPFGGVKETGNGHRESGWQVYEFYSEWKSVYIDFSGKLQKAQIDS